MRAGLNIPSVAGATGSTRHLASASERALPPGEPTDRMASIPWVPHAAPIPPPTVSPKVVEPSALDRDLMVTIAGDLERLRHRLAPSSGQARMLSVLGLDPHAGITPGTTPRKIMERLVAWYVSKGVPPDERLLPAIPFTTATGELGYVPLGEALPDGAQRANIIDDRAFNMMVDAGYVPVGTGEDSNQGFGKELSGLMHDIVGHITASMEWPTLNRHLIAAARTSLAQQGTGPAQGRAHRWYDAVESMVAIAPRDHGRVLRALSLPRPGLWSRSDACRYVATLSAVDRSALVDRLRDIVTTVVVDLGGAARDGFNDRNHSIRRLLAYHVGLPASETDAIAPAYLSGDAEPRAPDVDELGRVLAALTTLCELDPARWCEEAMAPEVKASFLTRKLLGQDIPLIRHLGMPLLYLTAEEQPRFHSDLEPGVGQHLPCVDAVAEAFLRQPGLRALPFDYRRASPTALGAAEVDRLVDGGLTELFNYYPEGVGVLALSKSFCLRFTEAGFERLAWHLGASQRDQGHSVDAFARSDRRAIATLVGHSEFRVYEAHIMERCGLAYLAGNAAGAVPHPASN